MQPDDAETLETLREYRRTGDKTLRNRVVERHAGLANSIAQAYGRSSEPFDDRFQACVLGLVKAADRFDPDRGSRFIDVAGTTMRGELRRHFRDHGWSVRVPRRIQDLRYRLRAGVDALTPALRRSPTTQELAAYLHVTVDDVVDALCADSNDRSRSLDGSPGEPPRATEAHLGVTESGYDDVNHTIDVETMLDDCPERLRLVLELRYLDEQQQSEIGKRVGVSQVHVSRLLKQAHRTIASKLPPPT